MYTQKWLQMVCFMLYTSYHNTIFKKKTKFDFLITSPNNTNSVNIGKTGILTWQMADSKSLPGNDLKPAVCT